MINNKKILCLIAIRSGSKSLKNKNIKSFLNKPLFYFSLMQAKKCKFIDKIIVSTDSKKYAKICKKFNVEVPFIRPKKYSQDNTLDIDVFKHALNFLEKKENFKPDYFINLRATSPIRKVSDLEFCIKKIVKNKKIDSIRSVTQNTIVIQKSWFIKKNYLINVVNSNTQKEEWNMPKQKLKKSYAQNGSIDIGKVQNIYKYNSMTGEKIFPFIEKNYFDIDDIHSFKKAEKFAKKTKILDEFL